MTQTQREKNKSRSDLQSIGGKIATFWKQPLFSIQFAKPIPVNHSSEKKLQSAREVKSVSLSKPIKRILPVRRINKPVARRNTSTGRKNVLYSFTPSRNKEEFEKILFVIRACDAANSTLFTNVLHVENTKDGSRLVATDGKRMHVTDIVTRLKPGNYKPSVTHKGITLGKSGFNGDYPNWERVVPVNVTRRGCINLENTTAGNKNRANDAFTKMSGEKINPNYLADLTKNVWEVYSQSEKRKAVLLREYGSKKTYAVIMPMSA